MQCSGVHSMVRSLRTTFPSQNKKKPKIVDTVDLAVPVLGALCSVFPVKGITKAGLPLGTLFSQTESVLYGKIAHSMCTKGQREVVIIIVCELCIDCANSTCCFILCSLSLPQNLQKSNSQTRYALNLFEAREC